MTVVLLLVAAPVTLPAPVSAQQPNCDGNFHIVHRLGFGESALVDIDFSSPLDGWAVGQALTDRGRIRPLVVRFDGTTLERVALPRFDRRPTLAAVEAVSPIDVWVVGDQHRRNLNSDAFAMHWDGSAWTNVTVPRPGKSSSLSAIRAFAPDDIWAAGHWLRRGEELRAEPLLVHFDGATWTRVAVDTPFRTNVLYGLDGSSTTDIWAVGYRGGGRALVLHWDGTEWSRAPLDSSAGDGVVYGVSAPSATDVWIAGWNVVDPAKVPLVAHWDGTEWQESPVPDLRGHDIFTDILAAQGEAWAVGARAGRDVLEARVSHWDGSAWSDVAVEGTGAEYVDAVTGDGTGAVWATVALRTANDDYSAIERACT